MIKSLTARDESTAIFLCPAGIILWSRALTTTVIQRAECSLLQRVESLERDQPEKDCSCCALKRARF